MVMSNIRVKFGKASTNKRVGVGGERGQVRVGSGEACEGEGGQCARAEGG